MVSSLEAAARGSSATPASSHLARGRIAAPGGDGPRVAGFEGEGPSEGGVHADAVAADGPTAVLFGSG